MIGGTFLADLNAILARWADSWSEADRALAETVALDITIMTQRSTMGMVVPEEEWATIRASIANLGAGAAVDGGAVFREWVRTVFAGLAKAVL